MYDFLMFEVEDGFICECVECGEQWFINFDEYMDMIDSGEYEIEDLEEDDDFDEVDEVEDELADLMDEMIECREAGDYEGYLILSQAYATLFDLIYE